MQKQGHSKQNQYEITNCQSLIFAKLNLIISFFVHQGVERDVSRILDFIEIFLPNQKWCLFQIDVVKDVPVGEGLFDHLSYPLYFNVSHKTEADSLNLVKMINPIEMANYVLHRKGKNRFSSHVYHRAS